MTALTVTVTVAGVLTVEELAASTGESVRTIRFYQSEGVLPPPARQGREARYDEAHVRRLQLISELQRRGLRLSAIRDLLQNSPDWLGLGESLTLPWTEDHPVLLGEDDLLSRIGDIPLDDLIANGVVERRADTMPVVYLVASPGMLDVAVAILRLGVDPDVVVRLRDLIQRRLHDMADDLVASFTEQVSLDHLDKEGPGGLAVLLNQLRPLTRRTVDLLFAHEMERAQRELLQAADAAPPETAGNPNAKQTRNNR